MIDFAVGADPDGGDDVVASATAAAGSGDDVAADVETGQVPVAGRAKAADGPAGVAGAA